MKWYSAVVVPDDNLADRKEIISMR